MKSTFNDLRQPIAFLPISCVLGVFFSVFSASVSGQISDVPDVPIESNFEQPLCDGPAEQPNQDPDSETSKLTIDWDKKYLTISGDFSGGQIKVHYLEAYCRAGSTDRPWDKTVIQHKSELISKTDQEIKIRDTLIDGVIVDHVIRSDQDSVTFEVTAHNPTKKLSGAAWAQPCIRVDKFTGCDPKNSRLEFPPYIKKCFLYLDGKLTRLPTKPWNNKARYVFGQVYVPSTVDRDDVNPRPLSTLVPSNGLCGCFSKDESEIMAVAWEPYQEIFQGVITCIHSDFRIGGLKPSETKRVKGKIYLVKADPKALLKRYQKDFAKTSAKD